MNIVSIEDLGKSQGGRLLFENISFGIEAGQKIALIGVNGCGKSSLLRLISGEDDDYQGTISRNRGLHISNLAQVPVFDPALSILDYVLSDNSPLSKGVKSSTNAKMNVKLSSGISNAIN